MYDNQILTNYMKDKNHVKCIELLKKKIITFVINQIRQKDKSIDYTTVTDLISISDFYLNDSSIAINLKNALMQEDKLLQIENLLMICEQYNIK